ncbi:RNA pyrophosphohydrolase [Sphingomicrobium astaxanthinifaciens]|uniref:RNA pyrophosphohydrolase n=1 Tax=Sphingomicrobium astaxanthinifaciens TaxID=1227949 RepID=UPI001FCC45F1|nr:RNA pyrophosphohydrolase [Sphingomicrobium astaxanthinifaciens]MCJ7420650.1 RNA pyrophosphohydrolase [Sphingomicrobium astaxanthinifaciens]
MSDDDRYRFGAGVMLLNHHGHAWIGRRIDNVDEAWQMPQGGIDRGEDSWQGALRELEEETGIIPQLVHRIEGSPRLELRYDLPEPLRGKLWGGRWIGQRQHWFLMRFTGEDHHIDIATEHPEFSHWQWAEPQRLPDLIVPFKRQMYRDILAGFADWIGPR